MSSVVDVDVKKTAETPQLQLINQGEQWLFPMVQTVLRTIETPQWLVDKVVAAPVIHVVQVPVVIFPVVAQRQIFMIRLFSTP